MRDYYYGSSSLSLRLPCTAARVHGTYVYTAFPWNQRYHVRLVPIIQPYPNPAESTALPRLICSHVEAKEFRT
jgi:hypothetical protein